MRDHADEWSGELGRAVRLRRLQLGLSQEGLAQLAGVGVRLVHEVERGKPGVTVERLVALLRGLGLCIRVEEGAPGLTVDA